MANLAVTYQNMGKYKKAEKLDMQVLDACTRRRETPNPSSGSPNQSFWRGVFPQNQDHACCSRCQDTQALDARGTVPQTETSNSAKVVLNPPVQAVLPDTIITPQKEGMSSDNCF